MRRIVFAAAGGVVAVAAAAAVMHHYDTRARDHAAALRAFERVYAGVQTIAVSAQRAATTPGAGEVAATQAAALDRIAAEARAARSKVEAAGGARPIADAAGRIDAALIQLSADFRTAASADTSPPSAVADRTVDGATQVAAAHAEIAEQLARERDGAETVVRIIQYGALAALLALLVFGVAFVVRPLRMRARSANDDVAKARAETETARAQLHGAIESLSEGVALFDAEDRLVLCNAKYRDIYRAASAEVVAGRRYEELLALAADRAIVADAKERRSEWIAERLVHHREPAQPVKQYLTDGRCMQIAEYRTTSGGTISIQTDITALERQEAVRLINEERTRSIVDTVIDGIITLDADGNVETFNPAAERIFGYAASEVIGLPFATLLDPAAAAEQMARLTRFLDEGDDEGFSDIREVMGRRRDGGSFPLEIAMAELRGTWTLQERRKSQRTKFIATLRDISARRRLAAQLQQAQKMEAIGTLAGGIAHDFNNILSIILGYASLVEAELESAGRTGAALPAEQRENIAMVIQAGKRARDLVQQILTFSRHSKPEKRPLDLQTIAKEVLKLMRSTLPATIEIKQRFASGPMTVMADPSQIHQVLMNLCTNAAQAMERTGGMLEVMLDRAAPGQGSTLAGDCVRLSVVDTGTGMDAATRERIFEPFFTTKEAGEGTGLGLSVVHGIVTDHGGEIVVTSEPHKGSRFDVLLPAHGAVASNDAGATTKAAAGRGRILFVDDEAPLVKMAERVLSRLGYVVVGETRSQAALDRFKAAPNTFDLVVTDHNMPGLTGDLFASEVRRVRGDIPIVLCTGNAAKWTGESAAAIGINEVVGKPLLADELGVVVGRVLANPHPA